MCEDSIFDEMQIIGIDRQNKDGSQVFISDTIDGCIIFQSTNIKVGILVNINVK
jgi:hypothetical protein